MANTNQYQVKCYKSFGKCVSKTFFDNRRVAIDYAKSVMENYSSVYVLNSKGKTVFDAEVYGDRFEEYSVR